MGVKTNAEIAQKADEIFDQKVLIHFKELNESRDKHCQAFTASQASLGKFTSGSTFNGLYKIHTDDLSLRTKIILETCTEIYFLLNPIPFEEIKIKSLAVFDITARKSLDSMIERKPFEKNPKTSTVNTAQTLIIIQFKDFLLTQKNSIINEIELRKFKMEHTPEIKKAEKTTIINGSNNTVATEGSSISNSANNNSFGSTSLFKMLATWYAKIKTIFNA